MKAVCKHVALCGLVTAVVSGCDQPKPNCLTAQAPFAVKLVEMSRSPGCTQADGPALFNADPEVGVTPYYARDSKGQPDYRKTSFAIKTAEIGTYALNAESADPPVVPTSSDLYSFGAVVSEEPDGNDLCRVPTLSDTRVVIPEIPAVPGDPTDPEDPGTPAQPPVDATLKWSDLAVYVTADSLGTQMRAHLSDTRVTPAGTCTIEYEARGIAPAVQCYRTHMVTEVDEKGKETRSEKPLLTADGKQQVDETKCSPEPHPEADPPRYQGSGIAPNANVVCDPETFFCVLAGDKFPAVK